MERNFEKEGYSISTDFDKLDIIIIHNFLKSSYWAKDIHFDVVKKALENSMNFGVYQSGNQVGFARLITDRATFAYLADVFILPDHRGKGLSKWLIQVILDHKDLQGLRSIMLATKDAHKLYAKFGFKGLDQPEKYMVLRSNYE